MPTSRPQVGQQDVFALITCEFSLAFGVWQLPRSIGIQKQYLCLVTLMKQHCLSRIYVSGIPQAANNALTVAK